MIFYDKAQAMKSCEEDPSLIFTLIKDGYSDIVYELIKKNVVSINTYDNMGNDVMMKLLKYRQYDLVINLMTKRDWKVNHQNLDGNTFGHILASDCSLKGLQIIIKLLKKKNYIPNIKNNKNETAMDLALKNKSVAALKFFEDKRFDRFDMISFKNLINLCINNSNYGKYSKINNMKIIFNSLGKKELLPNMENVYLKLDYNKEIIEKAIMKDNNKILNNILYNSMMEATN